MSDEEALRAENLLLRQKIKELEQLGQASAQARDYYHNLFEAFPALIWRAGTDTKTDYFNNTWLTFTGRSLSQELGDGWLEGVHPEDRQPAMQTYLRAFEARQPFEMEYRLRRFDGEYRWIIDRGRPFYDIKGDFAGYIGSCHDITTRRQLEEAVYQREQQFKSLAENATDVIIRVDRELRYLYANPAVALAGGLTPDLITGKTPAEIGIPAQNVALLHEMVNLVYETRQEQTLQYEYPLPEGVRYYQARLIPEFGADGAVKTVLGITRDISSLKETEAALAAETERLEVTLRSIGDAVIATDTAGRITLLNQVAEDLTGWSQTEASGQILTEVFNIVDEVSRERRENPVARVLQTGQTLELTNHTVLLSRDGREHLIADSAAPIRDKNSRVLGTVLVFRDVTEARRLSEEIFKSGKLESLGLLAGGIAHDFNNILTVIMGNVTLIKLYATVDEEILEAVEQAEKGVLRAKDLTQQLLTFAKGGSPVKKNTILPDVLQDAALFATRGSNVEAIFSLPADLWSIEADEGQLNRVIQNLVINAVQAMPSGGQIFLQAENLTVGPVMLPPLNAGQYVHISLRDEGSGIAPQHLPRIFDPYFSTKPQGSGLGLAVVYSIIKAHDGHIRVGTTPGTGTTFHLYLPAIAKTMPVTPPRQMQTRPLSMGSKGRVLVMDDEAFIREMLTRALKHLGHEVTTAKDGAEAIEIYAQAKAAGTPFDVVLMDLTVPGGMGGKDAIKQLLELDSKVKAIVSSGYSDDPVLANYQDFGFKAVVSKPYTLEELAKILRRVIEQAE